MFYYEEAIPIFTKETIRPNFKCYNKARLSWLLLNIRVPSSFLLEANLVPATTQGQLKYPHTQASVLGTCLIPEYLLKFSPKCYEVSQSA
jgi:hypothetical protein